MGKYIMLMIGIAMLLGYIICKIRKIKKYSEKVEAEIIKVEQYRYNPMDVTDYSYYNTRMTTPTYKYSYKGMTYRYNNGWSSDATKIKEGDKKIIRIDPNKPNKAYVANRTFSIVYLFFTLLFFIFGILSVITL